MSITQLPIPKKQPGFILAIDREYIKSIVNTLGFERFHAIPFEQITAQEHLVLKQRFTLESDPRYLQFLPYICVLRENEAGDVSEVLFYRRTKKVGESRLAGNSSLGLGGHVEVADVEFYADDERLGAIDLYGTFLKNMSQELTDEIRGTDPATIKLILEGIKFQGVITDFTNEVGNVHLGCLFTVRIPYGVEITVGEVELEQIGFIRYDELRTESLIGVYSTMENWTQIVINELPKIFPELAQEEQGVGLSFSGRLSGPLQFHHNTGSTSKAMVTLRPANMTYNQAEHAYDFMSQVVGYIGKRLGDPDDEFAGVVNLEERVKSTAAVLVNNKLTITTTLERSDKF